MVGGAHPTTPVWATRHRYSAIGKTSPVPFYPIGESQDTIPAPERLDTTRGLYWLHGSR